MILRLLRRGSVEAQIDVRRSRLAARRDVFRNACAAWTNAADKAVDRALIVERKVTQVVPLHPPATSSHGEKPLVLGNFVEPLAHVDGVLGAPGLAQANLATDHPGA